MTRVLPRVKLDGKGRRDEMSACSSVFCRSRLENEKDTVYARRAVRLITYCLTYFLVMYAQRNVIRLTNMIQRAARARAYSTTTAVEYIITSECRVARAYYSTVCTINIVTHLHIIIVHTHARARINVYVCAS